MKKIYNFLLSIFKKDTLAEEPVATVTELENFKKGTALITINGFRYFIQSPFIKEGPRCKTNETLYQYVSSLNLIEPLAKKLIKWFVDMKIEDIAVDENGLCYFLKDFRTQDGDSQVYLAHIHNGNMSMIFVIEQKNFWSSRERDLEHAKILIKTVSEYEKKHFDGYALLNPFGFMENHQMVAKRLHRGKNNLYCFLLKR